MRLSPLVLAVSLGVMASACHDKSPPLQAAADSTKPVDTVTTATTVGTAPAAKPARPAPVVKRENLVKVTEATPGLLAQAKILPIDAQHLAETVYPEGTVKSGTIERRGANLVYGFTVQRKDVAGTDLVLVNAADGSIVNTIHQGKMVAQNQTKPKPKP